MTKKERRQLRQKTIEEKGEKEFAEIKAKVKEQKRQSIEKHNMVATAMHKYITCATRPQDFHSLTNKQFTTV